MNDIDQHERKAIHKFLIEVSLPIIATEGDIFVIIGTGTLFDVAGRLFLISAAHILKQYNFDRWGFPTDPVRGDIMSFGPVELSTPNDQGVDICIAEILDDEARTALRKGWRVLSVEDVWLPDLSADCAYLCGYPSESAKFEKNLLHGRLLIVPTSFRTDVPNAAAYSSDAVRHGVDFFLDFKKPVNELTGENVEHIRIQGTSGSSIWAYRKQGWRAAQVWSPLTSLCVVGVQSAYVRNNYLRGKSWGVVFLALSQIDNQTRQTLNAAVDKIREKLDHIKKSDPNV